MVFEVGTRLAAIMEWFGSLERERRSPLEEHLPKLEPPTNLDASTSLAAVLWAEWVRCGLRHVVVSPGSRSTPLTLGAAACEGIEVHVVLDERSAGFFALGLARQSSTPVAVVCTSGSAGAHYLPAAWEARMARVPLLFCTADRPSELHDVGAPQTIDQRDLFGGAASFASTMDADVWHAASPRVATRYWLTHADRMWAESVRDGGQVVHCNIGFREPFVPSAAGLVAGAHWAASLGDRPAVRTVWGRRAPTGIMEEIARGLSQRQRGVIVAGWGAQHCCAELQTLAVSLGWPILADAISGVRTTNSGVVAGYDLIVRAVGDDPTWRPDGVLRIGAELTSKAANRWLADANVPTVHIDGLALFQNATRQDCLQICADPADALSELVVLLTEGDRADSVERQDWLERWTTADRSTQRALDADLSDDGALDEPWIARTVSGAAPEPGSVIVGASMPVRDVEVFARARDHVRVVSGRGTNGIDGFISTAWGHAVGSGEPTIGLCGDLTFLHGAGGFPVLERLDGAGDGSANLTIVVIDNDGGGIFSHLAQTRLTDLFDRYFRTPPAANVAEVAEGYGIRTRRVRRRAELVDAVQEATARIGIDVIVATVTEEDSRQARARAAAHVADIIAHQHPG